MNIDSKNIFFQSYQGRNDGNHVLHLSKGQVAFDRGGITQNEFNTHYSAEGWLGRKITALPRALWSGVIKTLYHLSKAVFIAVPKCCLYKKSEYLYIQLYRAARDLQESYGSLVSLFNDRHGLFHMQASEFHQYRYGKYEGWAELEYQTRGVKLSQLSKDQAAIIFCEKDDPKLDIIRFNSYRPEEVKDAIATGVLTTLYQLSLISDEQLGGIKLSELSKESFYTMFPISDRCHSLSQKKSRFANFKPSDVREALKMGLLVQPYKLSLISDDQFREIRLSDLSKEMISRFFCEEYPDDRDKRLFSQFDPLDVQEALKKGEISNLYQVRLISDEQFKAIKISELEEQTIDMMFPLTMDSRQYSEQKRWFAKFAVSDIQNLLERDGLTSKHQYALLSKEQRSGLDLTAIPPSTRNSSLWSEENFELMNLDKVLGELFAGVANAQFI